MKGLGKRLKGDWGGILVGMIFGWIVLSLFSLTTALIILAFAICIAVLGMIVCQIMIRRCDARLAELSRERKAEGE